MGAHAGACMGGAGCCAEVAQIKKGAVPAKFRPLSFQVMIGGSYSIGGLVSIPFLAFSSAA